MSQVIDFLGKILEVDTLPARWQSNLWSDFHGWLNILSDLVIWVSCFMIPAILVYYILKRNSIPHHRILLLFGGFILAIGFTHLIDAIIFWWPVYRFSTVSRFITAILSVMTVIAFIKVLPKVLSAKGIQELEEEIEQRKVAEMKLLESETRFKLILEGSSAGLWDWKDLTKEEAWWSPKLYHLLGYKFEELAPNLKNFKKLLHQEDRAKTFKCIKDHIHCRKRYEVEYRLRTKSGNYKWFLANGQATWDENGKSLRMVGSIVDINEKKKARELLRKSEQRYHQIIAEVQDYAIVTLDKKGHVQMWNKGAEKIMGYKEDEIVKSPSHIFYTNKGMRNQLPEKLLNTAKMESRAEHEGWRIRNDGSRFWSHVVITALKNPNGKVTGYVEITRDLTKQKKSEEKLKNQKVSLEKTNKQLEEFAYISSHDMKSPIASLTGLVNMMAKKQAIKPEYSNLFEMVKKSTNQMGRTVKALNNLVKVRKSLDIERSPVKFDMIVQDIKTAIYDQITASACQLVTNFSRCDRVNYPSVHVKCILQNLITNSIKYRHSDRNLIINIQTDVVNGQVVLYVQDNGMGIDLEKYNHKLYGLFNRFHTHVEGTGVGLHVIHSIIESYGGTIDVESEVNMGTTFKIFFGDESI